MTDNIPTNEELSFEDLIAAVVVTGTAVTVDVTNPARATRWLQTEIGRGKLSGFFQRGDQIVHTPREGEAGYLPLTDDDENNDGVAQIRVIDKDKLAAEVQFSYNCMKTVRVGRGADAHEEEVDAMFPIPAAQAVTNAPHHLPNLRQLRDVVHTPILRRNGTILEKPGYDAESRALYLPSERFVMRPIPNDPTRDDVREAVTLIDLMISGFKFVTEHDRANYIGGLLTPFLRPLVPAPYKMMVINAHQQGSGKTYLATALRTIHGGVFRSEMPENDAELRKQITTILTCTTSPIVHIDNVSGVVRSSSLAGLLSSNVWEDRTLGVMKMSSAKNNRLWTITGNNVALGGDLSRRAFWSTIDPGVPNPHLRRPEEFTIKNFEGWVAENRSELIRAALVIIRSWVNTGETPKETTTDSYAKWVATVNAIIEHAEIPGVFDSPMADKTEGTGADDEEWATFLHSIYEAFGDRTWTSKQLLDEVALVQVPAYGNQWGGKRIPLENLPEHLSTKVSMASRDGNVHTVSRSLGKWLSNRAGRWADGFVVRKHSKSNKEQLWFVERYVPNMDN